MIAGTQSPPGRRAGPGRPARSGRRTGSAGRPDIARPLPDPVAIRLRSVPGAVPPYDDEAGPAGLGTPAEKFAAAVVAGLGCDGAQGRPPRVCRGEPPQASGRPAPHGRAAGQTGRAAGQTGRAGPGWPSTFAQALAETLAGSRPAAQLAPWTTERARSHIRGLGPLLADGKRPLVQRVVTSLPAPNVVEMSVVVVFGPRVRALAVRLERTAPGAAGNGRAPEGPRWLCTAVEAA